MKREAIEEGLEGPERTHEMRGTLRIPPAASYFFFAVFLGAAFAAFFGILQAMI